MKNNVLKMLPALALLGLLTACEEEGSGSGDGKAEEKLANYFLTAETIASNTYSMMDQARRDSVVEAGDSSTINNARVYQDGSKVIIDFGNGELGSDGITRSGRISLSETGDYFSQGGSLSATFDNFKVEEVAIGGNMSVTNAGNNTLNISITNLTYGSEFSYNANKTVDWLSGFETRKDQGDDKFEISGGSDGTEMSNNNSVNATFTEKMLIDRSCMYGVVQGVIDLSLQGDSNLTYNKASLDFLSNDGCKNVVNITISNDEGGKITLPKTFNGF